MLVSHQALATIGRQRIRAEGLHPKDTNWLCRPVADQRPFVLDAVGPHCANAASARQSLALTSRWCYASLFQPLRASMTAVRKYWLYVPLAVAHFSGARCLVLLGSRVWTCTSQVELPGTSAALAGASAEVDRLREFAAPQMDRFALTVLNRPLGPHDVSFFERLRGWRAVVA